MALRTLILDTNILLDVFVFHDPRAQVIRDWIEQKNVELIYSPEIFAEYADVIARPAFALTHQEQSHLLAHWQSIATQKASPPICHFRCEDPDDQPFIDLAVQYRPSQLLSKDQKILKMHKSLALLDIQIETYPI